MGENRKRITKYGDTRSPLIRTWSQAPLTYRQLYRFQCDSSRSPHNNVGGAARSLTSANGGLNIASYSTKWNSHYSDPVTFNVFGRHTTPRRDVPQRSASQLSLYDT